MPHIVIEHSDNLTNQIKESAISKATYQVVVDSGLFSPEAVKARSVVYSDYVLPENAENFIHITVSILGGRDVVTRKELGDAVFSAARVCVPECEKLSVNIHEMSKDTYNK